MSLRGFIFMLVCALACSFGLGIAVTELVFNLPSFSVGFLLVTIYGTTVFTFIVIDHVKKLRPTTS